MNKRKLDQLVRHMTSGELEITGEPILISEDGILNNGRHQLLAVIKADAVLGKNVRCGISRKAF